MRPPLPSRQSLLPLSLHRPLHLRHLRRHRLADLQVRHLQLSQQIQQHRILFRRQVSLRFHLQCIQHVNEFPRRLRIEHRFASPRVRICTQHHRCIASDHPHQILKRLHLLRRLRRRRRCRLRIRRRLRHRFFLHFFPLRLALLLFHHFLAHLALGGKRPPVDHLESLILLVFRHGSLPLPEFFRYGNRSQFITGGELPHHPGRLSFVPSFFSVPSVDLI